MKTLHLNKNNKNFFLVLLASVVIALAVVSCSSDKEEKKVAAKVVDNPFDHSHDIQVTDVQKHQFEHDFADQCVQREVAKSTDKVADEKRWSEPCMCIATYLMKDLTAEEAKMFLDEDKSTQSLVIKFQSAAYHCLQPKTLPKGPKLFGKE
jgi:hypothetical protein